MHQPCVRPSATSDKESDTSTMPNGSYATCRHFASNSTQMLSKRDARCYSISSSTVQADTDEEVCQVPETGGTR